LRGEGFRGFIFLYYTKSFSFGGTQKFIGGGFFRVLGGLYENFKFNPCCYNILKIKNTSIINISLSFSKKILFSKNVNHFSVFPIFPTPQSPLLPSKLPNKAYRFIRFAY